MGGVFACCARSLFGSSVHDRLERLPAALDGDTPEPNALGERRLHVGSAQHAFVVDGDDHVAALQIERGCGRVLRDLADVTPSRTSSTPVSSPTAGE